MTTIKTARLTLRPITLEDAPAIQTQFNDYAIISELAARVPWPYPPDGALTHITTTLAKQGNNHWSWAITLHEDKNWLIGAIDLWRNPKITENRGFWLARAYWGKGYMTEATTGVTDYAFDELGFETLILSNALGNFRSRRVKEKAGAILLRTEPATFINPAYTHREIWELTKSAWQSRPT
jgi:RimJ/RimL family protein N-acetyltransferase